MVKMIKVIAPLIVLAGFATNASAIPIEVLVGVTPTPVGSADNILELRGKVKGTNIDTTNSGCSSSSGQAAETCWVNYVLNGGGNAITYEIKTDPIAVYYDATGNYSAFELQSDPEYFLVKNSTFSALVENLNFLNWGVVDLTTDIGDINLAFEQAIEAKDNKLVGATFGDLFNINSTTISHVTEFNGQPPNMVPEPTSIALLGMGLLGFAGAAVRRKRKG